MKLKNNAGALFFAVLSIIAVIVGIVTDNKDVFAAVYSLIIMSLVAYVIAYVRVIEREITDLKVLISKKS